MIVRILKNAKTFSAVEYNLNRVRDGEAEVLTVKNFGPIATLFKSQYDYKRYLAEWSSRNTRVKSPQFHVTISCEGKEYTKEQLQKIGEKWLEKMGYGKQPFIIYFHKNTDNNHIHIVTSRVDAEGDKINDKFENERAVRMMDEILNIKRKDNTRLMIADALKYSYATIKQFCAVLETMGLNVYEKDGDVFVKDGTTTHRVRNKLIDFCRRRYYSESTLKERNKNKAIVKKYVQQFDREHFLSYMKAKFGMNFVFFGKQDSSYGYCVVSHKNRKVFTGKELVPVKELVRLLNEEKSIDYNLYISALLDDQFGMGIKEINKQLARVGMKLSDDTVIDKLTGEIVCELDHDLVYRIDYNNRLQYCANKFNPQTKGEYRYLSNQFFVKMEDLMVVSKKCSAIDGTDYYFKLVQDLLDDNNLREGLEEMEIRIISEDGEYILIDGRRDCVVSLDRLDLDMSMIEGEMNNYQHREEGQEENDKDVRFIGTVSNLIVPQHLSTGGGEKPCKRKKKF